MNEIKPFKIRDIEINPPLILSPMAGVTDVSFRRLLKRRGGVGLTVSEFISVEGLTRNNPKSKRQMRFYKDERPFAVQVFGAQPERMRMAAEMAEEVGADILDINCGCPAPKVVKHGGGSGLLRDLPRVRHLPCTIVQGRYDIVCPPQTAAELAAAWPEAQYIVVPDAGVSLQNRGACFSTA